MLKSRLLLNIFNSKFSRLINTWSLQYDEIGDPLKVVYKKDSTVTFKLKTNEVLIKVLSAAIHPSDILTIQGQYAIKPPLPAVGGNEGYAQVIDSGTSSLLKEGDYVIPRDLSSGTWMTHKIVCDHQLIKIKHQLPSEVGAICSVNPSTAYRMLKDFSTLNRGSVFIQNGGTSAVAIYATQLAKLWGITSISIIRSRTSEDETTAVKNVLQKDYGATFVLTEKEVITSKFAEVLKQTGPARLALNCVGGKGVLPLLKGLGKSGIIVTYGGMNGLPLQLPVTSLIFSDVHIRGFWMSAWAQNMRDSQLRQEMLDELCDALKTGTLKPSPFTSFDGSSQWKEALSKSVFVDETPEGLRRKSILVMD